MSIERRVEFVVACDDCEIEYDWRQFDGIREAIRVIRTDGWTVIGTGQACTVRCPEHSRK